MTDERLRIWLGFWKWFLSTIVVTGGIAWATTIINAKQKDTELRIKINQEEKAYLTSFLERAMDDNLEKRFRFAQYFASVTTSDDYKKGWQDYLTAVEAELQRVKAEKEELESQLSGKTGLELEQVASRIRALEGELSISNFLSRGEPLQVHPLKAMEALLSYELVCPEASVAALWTEPVSLDLPDFPPRAAYVTYGCRDDEDREVGPFVSWYPNGQKIEEGEGGASTTLYYPNGNKAAEGRLIGNQIFAAERWSIGGDQLP